MSRLDLPELEKKKITAAFGGPQTSGNSLVETFSQSTQEQILRSGGSFRSRDKDEKGTEGFPVKVSVGKSCQAP